MLLFLIKNWKEILIGLVLLALTSTYLHMKNTITSLESDKITLQAKLNESQTNLVTQNILFKANEVDYKNKLAQLPKEITKIQTRYQTIYSNTIKWEKEANATDCNASMQYLNHYQF